MTEEEKRIQEADSGKVAWRKWGPYLSERSWGTVREDYSENGDAWAYFSHDDARKRAYRWNEDGIAGISDEKQILCFALAFWNGKDPILKERLFGLTGHEGNHGEDVKEYAFYLDNTPSHAYMKYLYKYPQEEYPYEKLLQENKKRTRKDFEYELLDTGVFDQNRYFDLFIEYAKVDADDILIQISAYNRGDQDATLHLLPHLWFRNTWSFEGGEKPTLIQKDHYIQAVHPSGNYILYFENEAKVLFTENETGRKDAVHRYLIQNDRHALNLSQEGTKAAIYQNFLIPAGGMKTMKLRLTDKSETNPFDGFEALFTKRKEEADAFYGHICESPISDDMRNVQRQAFAGLLWNKQYYHYNVRKWLHGDPKQPPPPISRMKGRNVDWEHFDGSNILSMPDKWEYPWFAAWDLAFHAITFAVIDPDFAKRQLLIMTREWYMHPNGELPAYEWEFSDVNPPVHAWAALRIFQIEEARYGRTDYHFLERIFQKLLLNFTWWVNRKDEDGKNIFEGGFLGLDNIGVFDRSKGVPYGGILEQPDGTGWMGMYCLNLLEIALVLSKHDNVYEDMATKFFEHFVNIAAAINGTAGVREGLWVEEEGHYCGVLRIPGREKIQMKIDSIVGFIPLYAVATSHCNALEHQEYHQRFIWYVKNRPHCIKEIGDFSKLESEGNLLLSIINPEKLKKMLSKLLDESVFLSPYGIRSNSKRYEKEPFIFKLDGQTFSLDYEPAESTISLFGGNSNWRGPIWFPLNFLLIESLQKYHFFLGDDFKVEYPTGSGKMLNLWEISIDLTKRLISIFLKDDKGQRPVYGGMKKFQNDPYWKDYLYFHEYFHGDNGAGLGASNQTGWTALVAKMIIQYGTYVIDQKKPFVIQKSKN